MTDKQIIKPRPICLYQDTCLHLKEKTRLCEDCVHYKNYWSELLEKEQLEKIKSLEQECEELKERFKKFHNRKLDESADLLCKLHKEECLRFKAEQKLKKIKDRCNETLELMNKDSGTNAYAGGRCTEAGQILHIIDEVE